MKKQITKMNNRIAANSKLAKFGNERLSILRRVFAGVKMLFVRESAVEDDNLWVLFRTNEHKAGTIASEVADQIELEYSRDNGVEFLDAFKTLCLACTPDYINKIFRMMFKHPVYFKTSLGIDVIKWISSLPSVYDRPFTVKTTPIKVEYLNEFYTKANMLTHDGPYISAKFITSHDVVDALSSSISGTFSVYNAANTIFQEEWDLPGVVKYSVTVTITYTTNTTVGSDMGLLMEIIRRCAADMLNGKVLWEGYFGEDHPQTSKKCSPYYLAQIGYTYPIFLESISDMTKTDRTDSVVSETSYAASLDCVNNIDYPNGVRENDSNFTISGDKEETESSESSFVITVYPPLEERPKKPVVNTVMDVHREDDNSTNRTTDQPVDTSIDEKGDDSEK